MYTIMMLALLIATAEAKWSDDQKASNTHTATPATTTTNNDDNNDNTNGDKKLVPQKHIVTRTHHKY